MGGRAARHLGGREKPGCFYSPFVPFFPLYRCWHPAAPDKYQSPSRDLTSENVADTLILCDFGYLDFCCRARGTKEQKPLLSFAELLISLTKARRPSEALLTRADFNLTALPAMFSKTMWV